MSRNLKPESRIQPYDLMDRYKLETQRVFLTGTQALVRLPIVQRALDRQAGLNTAGFISGYRGSPLGGYDQELWRAKSILEAEDIDFLPAINEDLAATAVMGTQQVETSDERTVDGVFSIWYGKGPGVDRAGDALKHGNAYGSSPHGGVLVVAGDDHGCVSSSMSHQSDVAFMSFFIPTLNPASVSEYIEFGLYGFAMSRYSGCWVGFKAISETVESGASIDVSDLPTFTVPEDNPEPGFGLHYRWPDLPGPQIEARMVEKLDAVRAFARANPIDKRIYDNKDARFGIITTGKGHLDLMEALRLLGIDEQRAHEIGIDVYKVGMVWPLETQGARSFLRGKVEVLVVEEKRGIIESELKEDLYDYQDDKPERMVGKYDEAGQSLIPWTGELSPTLLAPIVASRITKIFPGLNFDAELEYLTSSRVSVDVPEDVKRTPYFCAGCPHNTSTRVPDGSKALAGIGCHFMASWMDRDTESLIQMGGEGVNWVGKSRFCGNQHVFQNLGEGTYFHSGYLAIRQSIAAGTNITYKILFNDAVAMTGGQAVDGVITVPGIANQVRSEGVQRIAIVSDEPEKYQDKRLFPIDTSFHHRDEMDSVQRELREIAGVTVLVYDQACAAEKRRRRKRREYPDPSKRMFINEAVCEGCGDCSVQSNCLSIFPIDTELGRKRKIDQSSCNKDYSCVKGFCPSFVTVEGGQLRVGEANAHSVDPNELTQALAQPAYSNLDNVYDLLVAGVGGTGVVTISALIAMAAHLEGKGVSVLDFTGFAQKGGTVLSYVRVGKSPNDVNQVRIAEGRADAVVACDVLAGTDPRALQVLACERTRVLVNHSEVPSGQFVQNRNADIRMSQRLDAISRAVGEQNVELITANELMERIMGNTVYANMFLLGYAWQQGLVPLSEPALIRAIEINGVNISENKRAFAWGRIAADNLSLVGKAAGLSDEPEREMSVRDLIDHRAGLLVEYQDQAYAEIYREFLTTVQTAEEKIGHHEPRLTKAVATYLYKLMAYKDEYEVARLYSSDTFRRQLEQTFTGRFNLKFNLAPPVFNRGTDENGRPRKTQFGGWMLPILRILAHGKFLRGTALDPFGWLSERERERELLNNYRETIAEVLKLMNRENMSTAIDIATLPDQVRGFGPVKNDAIEVYYKRKSELLDRMRSGESVVHIVEIA